LYYRLQVAFAEHINNSLASDEYLVKHKYIPIDPESDALFRAIADGILLW
jgi:hypothetical protein